MAVEGSTFTRIGSPGTRLTPDLVCRQAAAAGCAAAIAGTLVGGVMGRLAMSLLASQNPEDAGVLTDDGFSIGEVTVRGIVQLLGASTSMAMVGAAAYMMVRPLLFGTRAVRVLVASYGFGVTAAALLIHPGGPDFSLLEPLWLPVVLFVALPVTLVAVFATLVEHWLEHDSWFLTAPRRRVLPLLAIGLAGGVALVIVVPVFLTALVWAAVQVSEDDAPRSAATRRVGQVLLAAIAGVGTWGLISDVTAVFA